MSPSQKILIVDDDLLMCWALERALTGAGYEVSVFHSGEEAKKKLETCTFDVVITDFKMAGMNGMDVLEEVRRRCPSTRSVLMTAFGSDDLARQVEEYNASYAPKPFQIEGFVERIHQLF
jgi:two-component system, NtrC family, nitrogen regulation response regulator GlnG